MQSEFTLPTVSIMLTVHDTSQYFFWTAQVFAREAIEGCIGFVW